MSKRPAPNWPELRKALWARADGFCEISGMPLDFETFDAHHRRPKGNGGTYRPGTDTLPNLLALAPLVHNLHPRSVHGNPSWSRPRGYLLPKHLDDDAMRATAVLYRGKTWVILDEDGDYGIMTDRSQRYLTSLLVEPEPARRPHRSQYR